MDTTCITDTTNDLPEPTDQDPLNELATLMADPSLSTRSLGALGERYAAAWLARQGYRTLGRNWRTRYGELDLITLSPERAIVFVEVKTRRSTRYGTPQEAVTHSKQTHLRRAGVEWLVDPANHVPHTGVRFDVIAVTVTSTGPTVRHIKGAF